MRRTLLSLALGVGLAVGTSWPASAQSTEPIRPIDATPFTANGTVLRIVEAPNLRAAQAIVGDQVGPDEASTRAALEGRQGNATRYAAFLTSDVTGRPTVIWIDLSRLRDQDGSGDFPNLKENEAVQIELVGQPEGSFLAHQYWALAKGSAVNNTDWGVRESYNTGPNDAIKARRDNVPDDDEALNQGDKFDNKGRRQKEDDKERR